MTKKSIAHSAYGIKLDKKSLMAFIEIEKPEGMDFKLFKGEGVKIFFVQLLNKLKNRCIFAIHIAG